MSREQVPRLLRRRVAEQAGHRCGYCLTQTAVVGELMEIDHIIPVAAGGETVEANLWLACRACNGFKLDRTSAPDPATGEPRLSSIHAVNGGPSISRGVKMGLPSLA